MKTDVGYLAVAFAFGYGILLVYNIRLELWMRAKKGDILQHSNIEDNGVLESPSKKREDTP
ncbi:MAG: hypothetical protein AAB229_04700 [Candidatus Hydrogenedentota bacterium]